LGAKCTSTTRVVELISNFLADIIPDSKSDHISERLIAREKLGSTGIGEGIAIPHSRLQDCDDTLGALFVLEEPVDFDSIDRQLVDIVFVLLVPEEATEQHLQTLSMLAQKFNDEAFRTSLRKATTTEELYRLATL
jgi:PTS system nitrogen regulatory IIA component